MALLIGITSEVFLPNECELIVAALDAGIDFIHLRKPATTVDMYEELLQKIPAEYLSRIVLHEQHHLALQYAVGGIHIGSRNHDIPPMYAGAISRSCHTLQEVIQYKECCRYLFLSPIYNSISKKGYFSAFTHEQLAAAAQQSIINHKVIALGGISQQNIGTIKQYHFGGAALLGTLWQIPTVDAVSQLIKKLRIEINK